MFRAILFAIGLVGVSYGVCKTARYVIEEARVPLVLLVFGCICIYLSTQELDRHER